jgi:hypothetical protein
LACDTAGWTRGSWLDILKVGWKMKWLVASLVVAIVVLVFVNHWRSNRAKRCYLQVTAGMTLGEVQAVMGRAQDGDDGLLTPDGEFERSWTFPESGERLTVVFDANGLSKYKEHGPDFCGVTPLMGKKKPRQ